MRRRPRYILPREKTIREGACSNARALTRRCDVLRNAVVFGKPTESRVVSHFDSGRASPVAKGTGKESARDRMRRYRDRAEECRAHAAEMKDPDARAGLIQVAESYERMAGAIEAKLPEDTPPKS